MREAGEVLGISIQVYGPETHMTAIVSMGMGLKPVQAMPQGEASFIDSLLTTSSGTASPRDAPDGYSYGRREGGEERIGEERRAGGRACLLSSVVVLIHGFLLFLASPPAEDYTPMFTNKTRALFFGIQPRAAQGRLPSPGVQPHISSHASSTCSSQACWTLTSAADVKIRLLLA